MKIRYANINDCKKMAELHKNSMDGFSRAWSEQEFLNLLPNHQILIAIKEANILGMLIWQIASSQAEILNITISNNHRRKNIAQNLMLKMLNNSPNIENVFLEVREDNAPAIAFYKKLNFNIINIRKNYYNLKNGKKMAAINMVLEVK